MSQSFCVSFGTLEEAVIKELRKAHPGALPISIEWKVDDHGGFGRIPKEAGAAVVWWVPSPEPEKAVTS